MSHAACSRAAPPPPPPTQPNNPPSSPPPLFPLSCSYDWFASHALPWPSLACRWGPVVEEGGARSRQRLYLTEQTDGSEPNRLVVVNVDVARPRTATADHLQGFTGARGRVGAEGGRLRRVPWRRHASPARCRAHAGLARWPRALPPKPLHALTLTLSLPPPLPTRRCPPEHSKSLHVGRPLKTILHPGEVNRLRELPQHPHVVVTHTDSPLLFVWNLITQADRTGVKVRACRAPGRGGGGWAGAEAWLPSRQGVASCRTAHVPRYCPEQRHASPTRLPSLPPSLPPRRPPSSPQSTSAKQQSTADLVLEGHEADAEFALGASGAAPRVASGGKDTKVGGALGGGTRMRGCCRRCCLPHLVSPCTACRCILLRHRAPSAGE